MADVNIVGTALEMMVPSDTICPNYDVDFCQNLPNFSIRNGDLSDVVPFVVRPTIPRGFHWAPVQALPRSKAISKIDLHIKSAIAQLTLYPPEGYDAAKIRKAGIVLGVARAVSSTMYDVSPNDLIPGESRPAFLIYSTTPAGVESVRTATGLADNIRDIVIGNLALTDEEKAAITVLLTSAIGVAPLQGYSLIMTGHHYLSEGNNPSKKAFGVVEKQVWKGSGYGEWFTSSLADIKDLLWHKACHPIKVNLKQQWASDEQVAAALRGTGVGAAASRLPAGEPELRAGQSYAALMQTVRPYFQATGGVVNYGVLLDAIDAVSAFPALYSHQPAAQAPAHALPASVPASVNDRKKALSYLTLVMQRNSDAVATAYGFYCTLSERGANMGGEVVVDTLRNSFALKKLRTQSIAAYTMGCEFYGDYAAAKANMRQRGEFQTPNVSLYM